MKSKKDKYDQIQTWRRHNRDKCRAYSRKYELSNRESIRRCKNQKNAEIKSQVMAMYGGKCAICHCINIKVLTIDHVNGDGSSMRAQGELSGNNLYRQLIKHERRADLQVLCYNCQWRKRTWGSDLQEWLTKDQLEAFLSLPLRGSHPRYPKQYHLRVKRKVMSIYGAYCQKCQCDDLIVLTIDHVNSDGLIDRRIRRGQNFYLHLISIPVRSDLQVLCFNCQIEKERNRVAQGQEPRGCDA